MDYGIHVDSCEQQQWNSSGFDEPRIGTNVTMNEWKAKGIECDSPPKMALLIVKSMNAHWFWGCWDEPYL